MTQRLPDSVGVVGLGLIGASLCQALRRRVSGVRLVGIDTEEGIARRAREEGLCDVAGTADALLEGVDIAVLATPLDAIPGWLRRCADLIPDTPVTDCGSTKGWIAERARALPGLRYLGGHPMAGRESGGYQNADAELFSGCTWVLTPELGADLVPFEPWRLTLEAIGAHVELMTPLEHDRAAAWASHLPLALSSALVRAAAAAGEWPRARWLTAGAFRDASRLAGGDPRLHGAIAATNPDALGGAIDALIAELRGLRDRLADAPGLESYFAEAWAARRSWLEERSAAGRPVA